MKDSSKFVNRLKDLMAEKEISVNKLSKAISCNNQAIARWFTGSYYPRAYVLVNMAKYYNCSVDYILGLTDNEHYSMCKIFSDFQTRYKELRTRKNFTDYHVAKETGIQQSTISKWIIRNQVPETQTLIKLASLFDCSVGYLIGISND